MRRRRRSPWNKIGWLWETNPLARQILQEIAQTRAIKNFPLARFQKVL